jgi:hypothetical protein
MAQQRLQGGPGELISRDLANPLDRNTSHVLWPSETPDRSVLSSGPRLPDRWPAPNAYTLTSPKGRGDNYNESEAWNPGSALVPRTSSLSLSYPQTPFSPQLHDDSSSQYRTGILEPYHQYSSISLPSVSANWPYPPSRPSRPPPNRNHQAGPSIERNTKEAQKLFNLIFHRIKKVWVDDWIKKAKQEIEKGQKPKDKLEEAISSIRDSSDNLPKSFSRDALCDLQDLLDKIKPEGGIAFKVLKECLINYAGNSIEHIILVVQNLLDLLNNGKKFLGLDRGTDSYPPPHLFDEYVIVYTTSAPKSKRKASTRSEESEESNGVSLGYKTSPCDNLKCRYCLQEQTNGQTGTWRTRQDAISCLISTLLSQESPWVCPAWLVQVIAITTCSRYLHPQLLISYSCAVQVVLHLLKLRKSSGSM